MISKKIFLPAVVVAAAGVITAGTFSLAHAQSGTSPLSGLAQAIAQKFNLNQTDVQNTISQYMQQQKTSMMQNMQQREKQYLDSLVQQGKITSAQEQAILDEQAKLKSEYDFQSMKNMTDDQRKQAMQNMQNEINSWAKSQGIDPSYLRPGFGMRGGHMGWHKPNTTATPTP